MYFRDRAEAGEQLAQLLAPKYRGQDGVVYALPRGGVIVAAPIARALHMPLGLTITRKIGHPLQPEYAIGAVTEDGEVVVNSTEVARVDEEWFRAAVQAERKEAHRRHQVYLDDRAPLSATGKTAILVDDGIATGLTMRAAIAAMRQQRPARLIVAVPIVTADAAMNLGEVVDGVVAVDTPRRHLGSVGAYYDNFPQVTDDEVISLLRAANASAMTDEPPPAGEATVRLPAGNVTLTGDIVVPPRATGLVLFAHGSGSSRSSPRNRFVAEELQRAGFATLLFDLLTEDEDSLYGNRFDIELLRTRLLAATDWARRHATVAPLPIGYFGASTGAAAALEAAAERPDVRAVVSRGGRPDLALSSLPRVRAATLLIVGGDDESVVDLNRRAYAALTATKALEIVPGATHLFQEPGALEQVARLAVDWFARHAAHERALERVPR